MSNRTGLIHSVSEVALWVEDLEKSIEFYRENLGFTVAEIDPGRNAFLKSGDFLLVLFNPSDPGTPLANDYLGRKGSPRGAVYHIAFRVNSQDLDSLGETLRERGLEVKGPVEFATGRRSYFLDDPDEHYIELTDL